MKRYLLKRMLLLPITLFAIILVNFVILNLAPLDPVTSMNRTSLDEASRSSDEGGIGEEQFLLFRRHYGLTLPILWNAWPLISEKKIKNGLEDLLEIKKTSSSEYQESYTRWGDKAAFLMHAFYRIAQDSTNSFEVRKLSLNLFIVGGTRQGWSGPSLTEEQKNENRIIANSNAFLYNLKVKTKDTETEINAKTQLMQQWLEENLEKFPEKYTRTQKIRIFFMESRFFRYMSRVVTLDFGTLRSDQNKFVVSEVAKRIKYSLTLSIIPMIFTFILSCFFGLCMAFFQNRWIDISLNTLFLILFSIPIFVAAPFLIEKVAISHHLPYGGFHSEEKIYALFTSFGRLKDIMMHLILPLTCVIYGTLAIQSRLSRSSMLNVMRQDHVKTAYAKGLFLPKILVRHIGKNALIPLVTSLASSLGLILGGSLIVETIFEINGFGRFFYDAVVNRDYNVVLFSALAGSFLTLLGYLLADICYTLLDPRIRFA